MNSEEKVELTPGRDKADLARQLLAVAADPGNPYRIEDVKTTSSGPLGLAFVVPQGLYDAWQQSLDLPAEAEAPAEKAAPRREPRGRKPASKSTEG